MVIVRNARCDLFSRRPSVLLLCAVIEGNPMADRDDGSWDLEVFCRTLALFR